MALHGLASSQVVDESQPLPAVLHAETPLPEHFDKVWSQTSGVHKPDAQ